LLFSRWRGQKKRKNLFSFFLSSNLPNSITHLTLSYHFNKSVDNLPNNITHLKFGYSFHQSVDNLQKNIKEVELFKSYKGNVTILLDKGIKVKWCTYD